MSGMKQFGKKSSRKQPKTLNDIAITVSKRFLREVAYTGLFSGDKLVFAPNLKATFNDQFRLFVKKNNNRTDPAVWPLFSDHVAEFSEDTFKYKRSKGSLVWTDVVVLLNDYSWKAY